MSNPSTIWASLSLPNPAVGSIPFVFTDNATIVTDVTHFSFLQLGAALSGSLQNYQLTVGGGLRVGYQDTTSVPGNATINAPAGRVKIALGAASATITSSYAFATSIIKAQIETVDATLTRVVVIPAAGSFIISGNANATGQVTVSFEITNVYVGP